MYHALRRQGMESVASGEPEPSVKRVGPGGAVVCITVEPDEFRIWEII